MRNLPRNSNVRQPYSDVQGEIDYYVGQMVEYLGTSRKEMGEAEWEKMGKKLKALDQAMLRTRAVLDPKSLADADWEQAAKEDAFQVAIGLGV